MPKEWYNGASDEEITGAKRSRLRVVARNLGISGETMRVVIERLDRRDVAGQVKIVMRSWWIAAVYHFWRVSLNLLDPGLTLSEYAQAKRLDPEVLRGWGLSDIKHRGKPAVRIPYYDDAGTEVAIVFRLRLAKRSRGDDRFWPKPSVPHLYGLNRLDVARARGYVIIVEGESDCHTLWSQSEPAIGTSTARNWTDLRDAPPLKDIPTIYAVIEPDGGGGRLCARLSASALRDRVKVVSLVPFKDVSELHCDDPERFGERWKSALAAAVPLLDRRNHEVGVDTGVRTSMKRSHIPRSLDY